MTYQASMFLNDQTRAAASKLYMRSGECKEQQLNGRPGYLMIVICILGAIAFVVMQQLVPETRVVMSAVGWILLGVMIGCGGLILLFVKVARQPEREVHYLFTDEEMRVLLQDYQMVFPWSSLKKVLIDSKHWLILLVNAIPNEGNGYLLDAESMSEELQAFLRAKLPCEQVDQKAG